jgi:predicted nuclease with TOPRIM domain
VQQKLKELEIEKRTLKSRLEQVEGELYKARKEMQEAVKSKD